MGMPLNGSLLVVGRRVHGNSLINKTVAWRPVVATRLCPPLPSFTPLILLVSGISHAYFLLPRAERKRHLASTFSYGQISSNCPNFIFHMQNTHNLTHTHTHTNMQLAICHINSISLFRINLGVVVYASLFIAQHWSCCWESGDSNYTY